MWYDKSVIISYNNKKRKDWYGAALHGKTLS